MGDEICQISRSEELPVLPSENKLNISWPQKLREIQEQCHQWKVQQTFSIKRVRIYA